MSPAASAASGGTSAGNSQARPYSGETQRTINRTEKLLDDIRKLDDYSIGDFLATMLNHSEHLSLSSRKVLSLWLSGNTKRGTRPAEIVDAMYRHQFSYTHVDRQVRTASFASLCVPERLAVARSAGATSFLPPIMGAPAGSQHKLLYNAREGMEEWAARLVLWIVDREATALEQHLEPAEAPTWSQIEGFSLDKERPTMKSKAPVMWAILYAVAFNKSRLDRKLKSLGRQNGRLERSTSSSSSSSESSGSSEPVGLSSMERVKNKAAEQAEMAAVIAIYMLIGYRNKMAGFFRSFTGIALFASNIHKSVFHILSRMRLSGAYSSVRNYLEVLAESAKKNLKTLGRRAFESMDDDCEDPQFFCFNFDNINQYVLPRTETVGNKSTMRNGTAATAIVLEDVPKGAFKREPYINNIREGKRRSLTVDTLYDAIDEEHRTKVGIATILRILTRNVDGLKSLRKAVELLFQDPNFCAVLRLRLRKTRMLTMGTSGINEALVQGASDVLDDLCQQAGMEPEWFNILLLLVEGDQLTVDRIRKAINYLDQEESIYSSKSWAIPLIQPWHMGWAYLKAIFRIHWFESTGKDTLGFRRAVGVLGRNPNPADYYPAEGAVVTVFETMVLSAARVILRQEHGMVERTDTSSKGFQLLEELERYFDPDGPLCDMDYLSSLAHKIYNEYMTTEAYHNALSDPSTPLQPLASDIKQVLRSKMEKRLQDLNASSPTLPTMDSQGGSSTTTVAPEANPSLLTGDQVLANGKLFMRDALEFVEFTAAMQEGDTGRLLKVIDTLVFAFWGSKSTNYGSELLEMACNMHYEYPEALKQAIMNNYLVNPSGLPGKWQAGDFLQEHFNKDIKTIYNKKSTGFDDQFMRESISLNITGFSLVKDLFLKIFHLARTGKHRAIAQQHQDINVLAAHFEEERFFQFIPGRTQPYQVVDIIAAGRTRLDEGALKSFLDRTLCDPGAVQDPSTIDTDPSQVESAQTQSL